ncbi:hypothetical protein HY29_07010 [Hyphomonas beringensis]|uniref:HTH tetR-type domain-containing protein n=1 Tax=Hyphomonas beringensis TaxID=1280946 RepID=A0A062TRP0_9PROT|nr:TetR family transcriptional regulator [Hyphomonas beringensis]KCZ50506.1 hypothetical protein HY29_07010 [Hyphomonas beringensis]
MTKTGQTLAAGEKADGRRQRSERSRAQIVDAMFALIQEGDMSPSAASVAERAGVGLRTVFRHFEDMDSLYGEIAEIITAEVMPKAKAPFTAPDWRGNLSALISRRAEIYEEIFSMRVSANLRRFQSPFLMEKYYSTLEMERATLQAMLPDTIVKDKVLFAAVEAAVAFQTWRRLRQDQNLDVPEAEKVVRRMTDALLTDY